jgi:hypothetical protein
MLDHSGMKGVLCDRRLLWILEMVRIFDSRIGSAQKGTREDNDAIRQYTPQEKSDKVDVCYDFSRVLADFCSNSNNVPQPNHLDKDS